MQRNAVGDSRCFPRAPVAGVLTAARSERSSTGHNVHGDWMGQEGRQKT